MASIASTLFSHCGIGSQRLSTTSVPIFCNLPHHHMHAERDYGLHRLDTADFPFCRVTADSLFLLQKPKQNGLSINRVSCT